MLRAFSLEGANAAFHQGVVVGIGCIAHRNGDMMRGQELLVGEAGVLTTPVGMMQQVVRFGMSLC